jgi:hypothetical protein
MRRAFLLALLCLPAYVQAKQCVSNWPWTAPADQRNTQYVHKLAHAGGSALVTMAVAKATDNVGYGIAAGIAVGAVREIYKLEKPGMTCEWSSMAFDAAGVAVGAGVASTWLVTPSKDGVRVFWRGRF